jgi:hypothetical protein
MTKINQIPQILVAYSPLQQPSPRMQTMIELESIMREEKSIT